MDDDDEWWVEWHARIERERRERAESGRARAWTLLVCRAIVFCVLAFGVYRLLSVGGLFHPAMLVLFGFMVVNFIHAWHDVQDIRG